MSSISVTAARANLQDVVERVIAGEEVTLTRHGVPVAVVVRPDTLRARRADAALSVASGVRVALEHGRDMTLADAPSLGRKRADSLIRAVRADRDAR